MPERPNIHDLGDLVRVATYDPTTGEGGFTDMLTGVVMDPDVVNLSIKKPDNTVATYVYNTDPEIEKNATGQYHMDVDTDQAGQWRYRWWSTGDGQAAQEKVFVVQPAQAVE